MQSTSSIFVLLLALICHHSFASPEDEIQSLPGSAQKPSFRQYSGYLNGGKGINIHYWFAESQGNPSTDPVLLWLTGGPGCSSLDALLRENGPFRVGSDGKTVTPDPHSWNTLANVVWFESPVGVGYSYYDQGLYQNNSDDNTARMNYLALEDFFRKFPQFKANPFYITGESYGGIYIPTLAVEILKNNASFSLKGLAIGNGFLDEEMLYNSQVELSLAHGFIDAKNYKEMEKACCKCSASGGQVCDFADEKNEDCLQKSSKAMAMGLPVDPYNIFNDCNDELGYQHLNKLMQIKFKGTVSPPNTFDTKLNCPKPGFSKYLNSAEVRKALHIPEHVIQWQFCGGEGTYRRQYGSVKSQVKQLVEVHHVPIIIYNGDLDMMCDFLGDQRFVDSFGYKLIDSYKAWNLNGRIAGFVKRYEGITYTAVRDAGHMVPTDQPEAGLEIIKELIGKSKMK